MVEEGFRGDGVGDGVVCAGGICWGFIFMVSDMEVRMDGVELRERKKGAEDVLMPRRKMGFFAYARHRI